MKKEFGFALPLILFSTVLIAALLAHLFHLWLEERERFQSVMKRLAYESERSEHSKAELLRARGSARWKSPPTLWSSALPGEHNRFLNTLLLKKRVRIGKGPLPDWRYIRTHSPDDVCRQMTESETEAKFTNSRTCRRLENLKSELIFIPANLDVAALTRNDAAVRAPQVIAIAGSARIGALMLNDDSGSLRIIALGDIEIERLVGANSRSDQLSLSSIRGNIHIAEVLDVDFCRGPQSRQTRLGLEAASGLSLGQDELGNNIYGCEIEHSGLIWPETQIIGAPS